jgi:hypothetical protein
VRRRQIETSRIKGPELEVKNIFEVRRDVERENFAAHLPNRRLLFHGSPASNLLGLLSRGTSSPAGSCATALHTSDAAPKQDYCLLLLLQRMV